MLKYLFSQRKKKEERLVSQYSELQSQCGIELEIGHLKIDFEDKASTVSQNGGEGFPEEIRMTHCRSRVGSRRIRITNLIRASDASG